MKQATEEQLHELLRKVYEQGAQHTLDEERGGPLLGHLQYDKRRDDFIEQIIKSI